MQKNMDNMTSIFSLWRSITALQMKQFFSAVNKYFTKKNQEKVFLFVNTNDLGYETWAKLKEGLTWILVGISILLKRVSAI